MQTILVNTIPDLDINPQNQTVVPEIPGNLGSIGMTLNWWTMLNDSVSSNANSNLCWPSNHRYMGHRESTKFNLQIQQLQMILVANSSTILTSNQPLAIDELSYMSDSDLAALNHIQVQLQFIEWLTLKNESTFWF